IAVKPSVGALSRALILCCSLIGKRGMPDFLIHRATGPCFCQMPMRSFNKALMQRQVSRNDIVVICNAIIIGGCCWGESTGQHSRDSTRSRQDAAIRFKPKELLDICRGEVKCSGISRKQRGFSGAYSGVTSALLGDSGKRGQCGAVQCGLNIPLRGTMRRLARLSNVILGLRYGAVTDIMILRLWAIMSTATPHLCPENPVCVSAPSIDFIRIQRVNIHTHRSIGWPFGLHGAGSD